MSTPEACDGAPPHLGNPELVKWGSAPVGNNINIKVPFVSKDVEYIKGYQAGDGEGEGSSDRWLEKETWTLSGEIINCKGYEEIVNTQQEIVDLFELDYQELKVGELDILHYGRVVSINFGDSDYLNSTSYEVVIEGYRSADEIAQDRRVIDPVATYTWTENEDGTMDLTYDVSAQGINTSDSSVDALENAKFFVNDYLSDKNFMMENDSKTFGPFIAFNAINSEGTRYVLSDEETIDRKKGSYGIKRTYRMDQTDAQYSVLRYTVDSMGTYGETKKITFDGYIEIGYDGDFEDNMQHLRDRYYEFKKTSLFDPDDPDESLVGSQPISERIDEDEKAGLLNFNIVFGEIEEGCIDDYDVSVDENAETSLLSVKINGQVFHHGPCPFIEVKKCFYDTESVEEDSCPEIDNAVAKYFAIAEEYYKKFLKDNVEVGVPKEVNLNEYPLEIRVSENPIDKTINYSIVFNDRISFGAHNFDYTFSISPPVREVAVNSFQEICSSGDRFKAKCTDEAVSHHYQDLGINSTTKFGFKGTVEGKPDDLPGGTVKKFAENLRDNMCGYPVTLGPHMTRNTRGGNQSNDSGTSTDCDAYNTYDYEWILGIKKKVVNSDSNDRTQVKQMFFGKQ